MVLIHASRLAPHDTTDRGQQLFEHCTQVAISATSTLMFLFTSAGSTSM